MNIEPFVICSGDQKPPKMRPVNTPGGLADRMRTAAFAEKQAIFAFNWACGNFTDAPKELLEDWALLIPEEIKHFNLIANRMNELGFRMNERPVSLRLWESLKVCETAKEFCLRIAGAEERGRQAGLLLAEYLSDSDPETAAVFFEIVEDEIAHIKLAETYYGWTP